MIDNVFDVDTMIDQITMEFGEEVFFEAVEELDCMDILFEGQFPFLCDSTMRDRNFAVQKTILKRYGYQNTENLQNFGFEVAGEGWMHCFVVFGNRFETVEAVKKAVISHFER